MARTRFYLAAILTLALAIQGLAAVAAELCITFGNQDRARSSHRHAPASAHDHGLAHEQAAHSQSSEETSGTVHCQIFVSPSIAPAAIIGIPARHHGRIASRPLPSRADAPSHGLERPPSIAL